MRHFMSLSGIVDHPINGTEAFPCSSSYGTCSISSGECNFAAKPLRVFWSGLSGGRLHLSRGGLHGSVTCDCKYAAVRLALADNLQKRRGRLD